MGEFNFGYFFAWNQLECAFIPIFSPLRALLGGFNRKEAGRTKWMNSPNVYQKVEVLETGTPDPKKITKVEVAVIEDVRPKK